MGISGGRLPDIGPRFEGWLFDVYPCSDGMVVWVLDREGRSHRLVYPYHPAMYIAGTGAAIGHAEQVLRHGRLDARLSPTVQRDFMSGKEQPVTRVAVADPLAYPRAARILAKIPELTLYNCDIGLGRLFFYETRLFPLAWCGIEQEQGIIRSLHALRPPEEYEYELPPFVTMQLRPDTGGAAPTHGRRGRLEISVEGESVVLDGDRPEDLVTSLNRLLERYDPDIILTEWGDSFLLPQLRALAAQARQPLQLNRDRGMGVRTRRDRSYMTYGQVVFQAGAQMLHGRWHLDFRNSFIYGESELAGLLDIARLSRIPVQEIGRTSTGTAISSMQLNQAVRDGILIPWQKSEPEAFKTASQLLLTDKGGLTYQPIVGLFEQVGELDFSSMYPMMMSRFNISPETVGCTCCPDSTVPEIGYTVCQQRRGLVPKVLEHLLDRRVYYKRRRQETDGELRAIYDQRQTALKWCLVTCLDGQTVVPVSVDGRIRVEPIEQLIDRFVPESTGVLPVQSVSVFGYDAELRPIENPVKHLLKAPAPAKLLWISLESGKQLRMVPSHRCFVLREDRLIVKPASQLTIGEQIPVARSSFSISPNGTPRFERVRFIEEVSSSSPFVYCFEVERGLHGFVVENGIFTSNSFGYLGYRNARFGRIEAHECVTAYSREMLLRAKEVAESQGYRMLHALVDSMWLHKPRAGRTEYEALARDVTAATDLPIYVEGVYRWIGFLPSRTHRGVGVPNRYLGLFEDGKSKVRGIEVRRSDVPIIVERMQTELLQRMFRGQTVAEVQEAMPELLSIVEDALVRLRSGDVTAAELAVTNRLSQDPADYVANSAQAITARTLAWHGADLHPGEAIQYVITDRKAKLPEDRVRPYTLLGTDWHYDLETYADFLLRAAETALELFGYPRERLRTEVWDRVRRSRTAQQ